MKAAVCRIAGLAVAVGVACAAAAGTAEETSSINSAATSVMRGTVPPLAPGVADIVKMARAKVGDSVILAYIENSGTVYNLDANQIVYLHDAGVSEPVTSAMLNQKRRHMEFAAKTAAQSSMAPSAYETTPTTQPACVEPQPVETTASSVYVIPYQPVWPWYGYYYDYFPIYPCFYGAVGFNRFHPQRFGFHSGFPHRFGLEHNFHSSVRGHFYGFHSSSRGQFHGRR